MFFVACPPFVNDKPGIKQLSYTLDTWDGRHRNGSVLTLTCVEPYHEDSDEIMILNCEDMNLWDQMILPVCKQSWFIRANFMHFINISN